MDKLKVILLMLLMLSACLHPLVGVGAYMLARFLFKAKYPKLFWAVGIGSAVVTVVAVLVAAGVLLFGGIEKFGPVVLVHSMGVCLGSFICTALFAVDKMFESTGKALHSFLNDTYITVHYTREQGGGIVHMKSPVTVTLQMLDAVMDAEIGSTALYTLEGLDASSITMTQCDENAFDRKDLEGGGQSVTVKPEAHGGREWLAMNRTPKDGGDAQKFQQDFVFGGSRSPNDFDREDYFFFTQF